MSSSPSTRARVWSLQSDAALCEAAARGYEPAYSELHSRHAPDLRAFVFHFLGSHHRREDAEDVVQDSFTRAFDAIAEHRFSGDFKRWIFTIARNRSIDLLRGERVRLVSLETSGVEDGSNPARVSATTVAVAEAREEFAWLVSAIEELPERQRSALLLRELAGLSHLAIAEEIGTTSASARQLITRARDGIRSAAERDGREREPRRTRSLRRDLREAAPLVPLSAAGLVASAGTTAGGGFAVGKLVATLVAALVLAGTAGPIARDVTEADGATGNSGSVAVLSGAGPFGAATSNGRETQSNEKQPNAGSRLSGGVPTGEKTKQKPSGADSQDPQPSAVGHEAEARSPAGSESEPAAQKQATQPVKEIVELPGKVVDHVAGALGGEAPLDQTVGNVVGDATDTLGDVTTGVLAPGSK